MLELLGMNLGRLSKSTMKSPCSPQPPVGVAVADEAGNGLVVFEADLVLELEMDEAWRLLDVSDCDAWVETEVVEEGGIVVDVRVALNELPELADAVLLFEPLDRLFVRMDVLSVS